MSLAAPDAAGGAGDVYEVNVKSIDGTISKLEIAGGKQGSDLKEAIAEKLLVPAARQRLIVRGRVLRDEDMIGEHIHESGLIVHMVQRPEAPAQGSSSAGAGADRVRGGDPGGVDATDADGNARGQVNAGPIHVQLISRDFGQTLSGFPEGVDLSQVMGTILGAVRRGGTATGQTHNAMGPRPGEASSSRGSAPGAENAPESEQAATASMAPSESSQPQMAAATTLNQPLHVVFQHDADVLRTQRTWRTRERAHREPRGSEPATPSSRRSSEAGRPSSRGSAQYYPWRELRRLLHRLGRILRRDAPLPRHLPPVAMPHGELHAALDALQAAMTQITVVTGELRNAFLEANGPSQRQQVQFAMALAVGARVLRSMAVEMDALDRRPDGTRSIVVDASASEPPAEGARAPPEGMAASESEEREPGGLPRPPGGASPTGAEALIALGVSAAEAQAVQAVVEAGSLGSAGSDGATVGMPLDAEALVTMLPTLLGEPDDADGISEVDQEYANAVMAEAAAVQTPEEVQALMQRWAERDAQAGRRRRTGRRV